MRTPPASLSRQLWLPHPLPQAQPAPAPRAPSSTSPPPPTAPVLRGPRLWAPTWSTARARHCTTGFRNARVTSYLTGYFGLISDHGLLCFTLGGLLRLFGLLLRLQLCFLLSSFDGLRRINARLHGAQTVSTAQWCHTSAQAQRTCSSASALALARAIACGTHADTESQPIYGHVRPYTQA